ncbi:microsomal glutathione S-transferase 1-like [Anopheles darlingi]|uniref:microsomal glutathione S-transferase 1-like n=1 Tax=Anopheles darlingi TaxID=43151 RepID=UPI00210046FA|nr:microsomal glutathione S-transferase 1-like [Anopheles darlingi]
MSIHMLLQNVNEDVLRTYVFWVTVLVVKMLLMLLFTVPEKVFTNSYHSTVGHLDRVKRAHKKYRHFIDLILPYLIIGLLYILTGPSPGFAIFLFRTAAICRILHTLVDTGFVIAEPTAPLSVVIVYLITFYMAIQTLLYFL